MSSEVPKQKHSRKSKHTESPEDSQPERPSINKPVAFDAFAVKEDANFSQMKNNIITQSTRVCEILSDASKFSAHYEDLTNNIIGSMNEMISHYNKAGKKSILVDIFEAVTGDIDWDQLKTQFQSDMMTKGNLKLPKYTPISTDLKRFKIDLYDTDILFDMHSNMDEYTVKEFAKAQEEANNNLYELIDNVTAFESGLCSYRTSAIAAMKENVKVLYTLHVNYAKAIMNKDPKIPDSTTVNGKVITFQKGQKPFILAALRKIILDQ